MNGTRSASIKMILFILLTFNSGSPEYNFSTIPAKVTILPVFKLNSCKSQSNVTSNSYSQLVMEPITISVSLFLNNLGLVFMAPLTSKKEMRKRQNRE